MKRLLDLLLVIVGTPSERLNRCRSCLYCHRRTCFLVHALARPPSCRFPHVHTKTRNGRSASMGVPPHCNDFRNTAISH